MIIGIALIVVSFGLFYFGNRAMEKADNNIEDMNSIIESSDSKKDGLETYLNIKKEDIEGKEVSGVFPLLGALIDEDERVRIEAYFTCHGGITYSGGGENSTYPIESNLWWFGFDCAHYGDGKDLDLAIEVFPEFAQQIARTKEIEDMFPTYELARSTEYVSENCKELADQLAQFSCIVK